MGIEVGSVESSSGDINLNEAGGNITQIKSSGQIDLSMFKMFLQENGELEKYKEKLESLETALKNKDIKRVKVILGFLTKVAEAATIRWLSTTLVRFF